ncbi:AAA family ATPase [Labrys neptuniae]|uniref:AAA family ATPase n=1 Tax=Labrys neptuniae TaxID=376174 RepID=A0ABV3PIM1_9HYPH
MESSGSRRTRDDFPLAPLVVVDPIRFQGLPIPERQWLLQGWIPLGAVTSIYGDGGAGKSLLAQLLATCCATGRDFLGFSVMRCKVLAIFCEDDNDELQRRQAAINQTLGIDFADLEGMQWVSRVGMDNSLVHFHADGSCEPTPLYFQIIEAAKAFGAQLVIIDTAADTFAGNENIRPQVRAFISALTRIAIEIGGAVVLLAHPSQTGKNSGSGDGGSTAWNNSVRSRIYLERPKIQDGETADPDRRILSRQKANYATAGVELQLRYQDGVFVNETPTQVAGSGRMRQAEAEDAFIAGLRELGEKNIRCNVHRGQANFAPKALREKTKACASFSDDELGAALNRLLKASRVKSVEEGSPSRRRSYLAIIDETPPLPGL